MTIKNRSSFGFYYEKQKSPQLHCSNKSLPFETFDHKKSLGCSTQCGAKCGTGGGGLYKTPVVTALGGGIGLAVNVTGGKYNVNVQYISKPGRPAHWEAELLAIAHVTQQQFSTAQLMGRMNKYDTCPL